MNNNINHTFDLEDLQDEDGKVYLYSSIMSEQLREQNNDKLFVGIINGNEDDMNINFDLENDDLSNVIGSNVVDIFLAEENFNKFNIDNIPKIFDYIYNILKPRGLFRLSMTDYRTDFVQSRVIRNADNTIKYDPGSGSIYNKETDTFTGGALWFPTIEIVKNLISKSKLRTCDINYIQYYNEFDEAILGNIDYSFGYIKRTPDNDERVKDPKRPLSIVVDIIKNI